MCIMQSVCAFVVAISLIAGLHIATFAGFYTSKDWTYFGASFSKRKRRFCPVLMALITKCWPVKKLRQSKFNPYYLILILGAMNNIFNTTLDYWSVNCLLTLYRVFETSRRFGFSTRLWEAEASWSFKKHDTKWVNSSHFNIINNIGSNNTSSNSN